MHGNMKKKKTNIKPKSGLLQETKNITASARVTHFKNQIETITANILHAAKNGEDSFQTYLYKLPDLDMDAIVQHFADLGFFAQRTDKKLEIDWS